MDKTTDIALLGAYHEIVVVVSAVLHHHSGWRYVLLQIVFWLVQKTAEFSEAQGLEVCVTDTQQKTEKQKIKNK